MASLQKGLTDLENLKCNLDRIIHDLKLSMEEQNHEFHIKSDELKQLSEELVEVSTSKRALQVKVDELESAQANIKSKEKRMAEEKEILNGKISELKAKNKELVSNIQPWSKLKSTEDELKDLKTENQHLVDTVKKLVSEVNQLRLVKTAESEAIQQILELEEETRKHLLMSDQEINQLIDEQFQKRNKAIKKLQEKMEVVVHRFQQESLRGQEEQRAEPPEAGPSKDEGGDEEDAGKKKEGEE